MVVVIFRQGTSQAGFAGDKRGRRGEETGYSSQHNYDLVPTPANLSVWFLRIRRTVAMRVKSSSSRSSILSSANDWCIRADLDGKGGFPREIFITALRPDIVIWSEVGKEVIIGEMTVPWEDNIDESHERKLTKYAELRAECKDRGWKASCYPFEVGCRGFVAHSL
ncbi:uncharacterized protein [Amphiura filiformis]|uniref:uncharacterized protein n=1 Tax=Amphiura filiformis TaxID=82378 RepID=UPI003B211CC3